MNRFLSLGALVASLVLASGEVSAQQLSVNPYQGLGFTTPAPPDLCKVGTSGVDADARNTARNIAEAPGSPPELEINNCHLHAVDDSFAVSSPSTSPCHPDHEPPLGDCGRPLSEWCDNPCTTNACGQTGCLSAQCPVIVTTHEVLAPSWSYTFPLDVASSHELSIDTTHQRKDLRGNCTCTTYSTPACPSTTSNGGGADDYGGPDAQNGGGADDYGGPDAPDFSPETPDGWADVGGPGTPGTPGEYSDAVGDLA